MKQKTNVLSNLSLNEKLAFIQYIYKKKPDLWAKYEIGIDLDDWQKKVLCSTSNRILLNCSRQSGKSTTSALVALHTALFYKNSLILCISPSLRQSAELFRKIKTFYDTIKNIETPVAESSLRLELRNKSRIVSLPGSEGTIRGFSGARLIIIDEAARVDDDLYYSVLPMLAVSKGRLIAISTPFGTRGWWYEECEAAKAKQSWEYYEVTVHDCPRISKEFIEEARRTLGSKWFSQEFECKFVSSGITRLQPNWIKYVNEPPQNLKMAMGVDLAISEKESADWTAIVVLGKNTNNDIYVLDARRMRGSFKAQQDLIKSVHAKWNVQTIAIEDVAYQRVMIQEMNRQVSVPVVGIKSSVDKITRFAPLEARYEAGQVYHLRGLISDFEKELLEFPVGEHDDFVDAMSIAYAALNKERDMKFAIPTNAIKGRGINVNTF